MNGSKEWADAIIGDLRRIQAVAREGIPMTPLTTAGAGQPDAQAGKQTIELDPDAVARALAKALKTDNQHTQAIAVRSTQLFQRYPKKAY